METAEPENSNRRDISRARLFIENMLVYGLGGVLGKLVPLVMLPVVTRLMPGTTYFGLSDLSNTLVQFGQAFAIMGMYDAMFRMFFEEADFDYKKSVCTTALFFVTGMSLVVAISMMLFRDSIASVFFGSVEFSSLVVVSAFSVLVGGNNSIVQAPTRMRNQRKIFIVMNLVTSVLSYAISVPMLLAGQYLMALPVAAVLASATALVVFGVLNRSWFSPHLFDKKLLHEMLAIGIPLMPTFIFYWIFNSADRLMIVNILGTGASGVYAVSAKIGHMSQLIYTAFSQGWQYFAFSTMKDGDQVELNSKVYEYLGVLSFAATGLLCVVIEPVFVLLFPGEYYGGATSSPYLFLAPLLLMLYQVVVNQLLVIKKTWPSLLMLAGGAIANIAINWILIPIAGIEGAAIATLVGYIITNVIALLVLSRMGLVRIRLRFFVVALSFVGFFLTWRLWWTFGPNGVVARMTVPSACWILLILVILFQYKSAISGLIHRIKPRHAGD